MPWHISEGHRKTLQPSGVGIDSLHHVESRYQTQSIASVWLQVLLADEKFADKFFMLTSSLQPLCFHESTNTIVSLTTYFALMTLSSSHCSS